MSIIKHVYEIAGNSPICSKKCKVTRESTFVLKSVYITVIFLVLCLFGNEDFLCEMRTPSSFMYIHK